VIRSSRIGSISIAGAGRARSPWLLVPGHLEPAGP
jgi:hypothetical protein